VIGGRARAVNAAKVARNLRFFVVLGAALLAAVLVAGRAEAQVGDAANAPSDCCVGRFLTPIEAMAGLVPAPSPANAPWLPRIEQRGRELALRFGNANGPARLDVLVATIADPIDSGLGYQYETSLQTLRRGVEHAVDRESLYRDRSFLPWDDRDLPDDQQKQAAGCRVALPGIMLFRGGADPTPHLLAVLLVGESPTSGLRQAALLNALAIARALAPELARPEATLRLVGPTFSGSAQSLHHALRAFALAAGEPLHFRVRSGTATGADLPAWLGTAAAPLPLAPGSDVRFDATTVPEADAECAYFHFLRRRLGVPLEHDGVPRDHGVPLARVATLVESGTEFGATPLSENAPRCAFRASSAFAFPFHVSALRDAYEDLDQRAGAKPDGSIARATSLDASLREPRVALDTEAPPSPKTQTAVDLTLSNVLERLVTREVRYLGIHATDVGDAIFLARKIRDVAPDVRLAFFDADTLLLHGAFERELLGSLVVSPYPFLGLSELSTDDGTPMLLPRFDGFENGAAEGLFNAVVATRAEAAHAAKPLERLREYTLGSQTPLPVWIATVGRGTLVPNGAGATPDCAHRLFGTPDANPAATLCSAPLKAAEARRDAFRRAEASELRPYPRATLPNAWFFLYVLIAFGLFVDVTRQNLQERKLETNAVLVRGKPIQDQTLDLAIGRTKWRLYATIRSFLFVLALAYMGSLHVVWFVALGALRPNAWSAAPANLLFQLGVVLVSSWLLGVAVLLSAQAAARFLRDYRAFGRWAGENLWPRLRDVAESLRTPDSEGREPETQQQPERASAPPSRGSLRDRISLTLGVARPVGRLESAHISFAQLRLLVTIALTLASGFTALLFADTWNWVDGPRTSRLVLMAFRDVRLASGVCPSTPALLCLGCVYLWAVGRMARLTLAHSVSRASPPDGEADLVSTPLRVILFPGYARGKTPDGGFTEVERDVLNAIWRPVTGNVYPMTALGILTFPVVVFWLEPLSTLESSWGSWLLRGGLWLSVSLLGVTLVQLVQFWLALQRLLRRTLEHPLGTAFDGVPSFARDSLDHQLSRTPAEMLRWAACARLYAELVRERKRLGKLPFACDDATLALRESLLLELRNAALAGKPSLALSTDPHVNGGSTPPPHPQKERADAEVALAQGVILAASSVMQVVEEAAACDAEPSAAVAKWLESARVFAATVVTLLIHRHVRQFRHFMQVTTGSTLLLLFAVTSYPFEPYRMLLTFSWLVVLSVVALSIWVFVELDRNTLMSHVNGTRPGEVTLNWALFVRVLSFGAVPLLSVAAAQYPQIATLVFRTLSPLSGLLH
jgi:hypothetical protein